MISKKIANRAWEIRRAAAKKWGCGVMQISWKGCLQLANCKIVTGVWMGCFQRADTKTKAANKMRAFYKDMCEAYPERSMMEYNLMSKNDSVFAKQVMLEMVRTREVEDVTDDDSRYRIIEVTTDSKRIIAA